MYLYNAAFTPGGTTENVTGSPTAEPTPYGADAHAPSLGNPDQTKIIDHCSAGYNEANNKI